MTVLGMESDGYRWPWMKPATNFAVLPRKTGTPVNPLGEVDGQPIQCPPNQQIQRL